MSISLMVWIFVALASAFGLVAGIFLSFSDFIMRALFRASAAGGIEAMQMINRTVYQSVFMLLLMGLAVAAALVVGYGIWQGIGPATSILVAGGLAYLIGVIGVTGRLNVPMNNLLDQVEPSSLAAAQYWQEYYVDWTRWNHVRTGASFIAMICFMVGAIQLAQA